MAAIERSIALAKKWKCACHIIKHVKPEGCVNALKVFIKNESDLQRRRDSMYKERIEKLEKHFGVNATTQFISCVCGAPMYGQGNVKYCPHCTSRTLKVYVEENERLRKEIDGLKQPQYTIAVSTKEDKNG